MLQRLMCWLSWWTQVIQTRFLWWVSKNEMYYFVRLIVWLIDYYYLFIYFFSRLLPNYNVVWIFLEDRSLLLFLRASLMFIVHFQRTSCAKSCVWESCLRRRRRFGLVRASAMWLEWDWAKRWTGWYGLRTPRRTPSVGFVVRKKWKRIVLSRVRNASTSTVHHACRVQRLQFASFVSIAWECEKK